MISNLKNKIFNTFFIDKEFIIIIFPINRESVTVRDCSDRLGSLDEHAR